MSSRGFISILLGIVAAFFLHREQDRGSFAPLDRPHVQWLLDNRKEAAPREKPRLVFVRLDDLDRSDGERQFESWPPSATEWAGLLEEIQKHRPEALAVLPTLAWGGAPDAALTKQIGNFRKLLFGLRAEGAGPTGAVPAQAAARLTEISSISGDRNAIPQFVSLPAAEEVAALGAMAPTHLDLTDFPEGKISIRNHECRLPLLFRLGNTVYPSLLLQAVCLDLDLSVATAEVRLGEAIRLSPRFEIPIDPAGGFTLHLHSVNDQPLPSLNLDTFKLSPEQLDRFLPKGDPTREILPKLRGALLWIGQDDQASRRLSLPQGGKASPAELSARALMAIETGRNLAPVAAPWQFAACGAAILVGLWQSRRQRRSAWKIGAFGVLLAGIATLLVFQSCGRWLPLGPMLGILALETLANFLIGPPRVATPDPTALKSG